MKKRIFYKEKFSKEVFLTTAHSNWPCPDGAMYDPENKLSIGNGNEETAIWKWERGSESANGNEESVVTTGMGKRNFVISPKTLQI